MDIYIFSLDDMVEICCFKKCPEPWHGEQEFRNLRFPGFVKLFLANLVKIKINAN